jgi:hypothetical protein
MTPQQNEELKEVFTQAEQRRVAAESKKIQEQDGYKFANQTLPKSFNFLLLQLLW